MNGIPSDPSIDVTDNESRPSLMLTGASGFLGRAIAMVAVSRGWSVHGIDILPPENAPKLAAYHQLSLPDTGLEKIVEKLQPCYCIHAAGRASVVESVREPLMDFETGPQVTIQLLDCLRRFSPHCRLVFLSSAAVYGNPKRLPITEEALVAPISPYGFHKYQCEILCREFSEIFSLKTASVRIFSAYGPGLRRQVLWDICRKVLSEKRLELRGTGSESRDFIHSVDVAHALLVVAEAAPLQGEVYNVASGRETSIAVLAKHLTGYLGEQPVTVFDGQQSAGDPNNWCADIGKIGRLGFSPKIEFTEGLKSYARWAREELGDFG